jgi:class 3 adenylate cyclase
MSQTRQLAAILFADIAGYTAMMEADEARAFTLRDKFKKTLESETALQSGRIIKFSGDGALCIFNSAGESVRAAMGIQFSMQQEPKIPLRIGIHQADVVFDEGDVHGDGVNIASRLESFAVPGSIFISTKVQDDIKNQKDILTESLGKYTLKNVKEPVEIFAVSNAGLVVPRKIKLEGKGEKYNPRRSSAGIKKTISLGIIALIAIAAAGFYIYFYASGKADEITVLVHGKKGKDELVIPGRGKVKLIYGDADVIETTNDKGEVVFKQIPPVFFKKGATVELQFFDPENEPYRVINPDSLYELNKGKYISLEVLLFGLNKIKGVVQNMITGLPLDSVRVSIIGTETYSNQFGEYTLSIPDTLQDKFQNVHAFKNGFEPWEMHDVPVQTKEEMPILLKPSFKKK